MILSGPVTNVWCGVCRGPKEHANGVCLECLRSASDERAKWVQESIKRGKFQLRTLFGFPEKRQ